MSQTVSEPFSWTALTERDREAVQGILAAAQANGANDLRAELEQRLAHFLDVQRVLLTDSWDSALRLTACVLGWGPGDEIILPSFASESLAAAILDRGARPVFAEIDEATWTIDPVDVASRIVAQTRAIIPVHYGGQSCDMVLLGHIARRFGVAVVEDASEAVGAKFAGRYLGTGGDISCLCFQVALDTFSGEVGAFVTSDPQLAQKAEALRDELSAGRPDGPIGTGTDSADRALSDVLAACVQLQLARLDDTRRLRRAVWWRYQDLLSDLAQTGQIILPWTDSQIRSNWQTYAFRLAEASRRDELISFLNRRGVRASAHFAPLHLSPLVRAHHADHAEDLPITDRVSSSLVRLPLDPALTPEEQEYVVEVLLEFFCRPKTRPLRSWRNA